MPVGEEGGWNDFIRAGVQPSRMLYVTPFPLSLSPSLPQDSAYERARKACEALQRQVAELQEQVIALSQRPNTASVGVSTSSPGKQDTGMMAGEETRAGTLPPTAQVRGNMYLYS